MEVYFLQRQERKKLTMNHLISYPILCNYYITTRCNARCIFCDIYKKKGKDAKPEEVFKNLVDLKKIGVKFIDLTGGEPLLHPALPEFLRMAKKLGFLTTVTTNCILYPKRAREIAGMIDLLHFSLDSPIKSEHDRIRGVPCFDSVIKSLHIAETLGEKPDILFTVTEENVKHLSEMARLAKSLHRILLVNPVFSYFDNPGIHKETLDLILSFASEPYVYVNRGIIRFMKKGGNLTNHPRCRAVTTTIVISPDNYLLLPCYHKAIKKIPINNNLLEIYQSEIVKHFKRMEGRFSFCQGCTISCYFDPSFTYGIDTYFLLSQLSKVKYTVDKYLRAPIETILEKGKKKHRGHTHQLFSDLPGSLR